MGKALFEKQYELIPNPPHPVDIDVYFEEEKQRYLSLLDSGLLEKEYQRFFESNPAFMPGAFELIGQASGHSPIMNALISQPFLGNEIKRKPDFMWLAKDSLCLSPVFIEIERPSKKEFRKDEAARATFTQAVGQIKQWKTILATPERITEFYDRYSIPGQFRKLKFRPSYILIYGRREEYLGKEWLTGLRAAEETDDFKIMSFDRLANASRDVYDMVTCKVINGRYMVMSIPPTYVYRPCTAEHLKYYEGFYEAIDQMSYTTPERKDFLKKRYEYWKAYGSKPNPGPCNTSDKE